jgi:hypothetical protein
MTSSESKKTSILSWKNLLRVVVYGFALVMINYSITLPDHLISQTSMRRLQVRICNYAERVGHPPVWLDKLPPDAPNYGQSLLDAWGQPFGYRVENEMVTLRGLGADGVSGGTGEDEDMYLCFDPKAKYAVFELNASHPYPPTQLRENNNDLGPSDLTPNPIPQPGHTVSEEVGGT